MADSGGRNLSIESVLGGTVPFSVDILYETKIDKEAAKQEISTTTNTLKAYLDDTTTKVTNIQSMMAETNSKRFNNPDDLQKLVTANEDLEGLYNSLKALNDKDIEGIVNRYNSELKKLKIGARYELLKNEADRINAAAENGTSDLVRESGVSFSGYYSKPNHEQKDGGKTFRFYTKIESYEEEYWPPSNYNRTPQKRTMYRGTYTDFKYINYWGPVDSRGKFYDHWPWNSQDAKTVEAMEKKFSESGVPLPYDASQIVEI